MGETIPVTHEKLAEWAKTMRDATNEIESRNARIAALEQTERELREAVKVLAENAHNINHLWELERNRQHGTGDWLMAEKHVDQSWREVMSNPIAAAAVREAGK